MFMLKAKKYKQFNCSLNALLCLNKQLVAAVGKTQPVLYCPANIMKLKAFQLFTQRSRFPCLAASTDEGRSSNDSLLLIKSKKIYRFE